MQLRNAAGQVVYETSVTPNDIEDQSRVCLDTGVQSADKNGYTLSITKHAGSKQDMSLWTEHGHELGFVYRNDDGRQYGKQTDLYMSVYRK